MNLAFVSPVSKQTNNRDLTSACTLFRSPTTNMRRWKAVRPRKLSVFAQKYHLNYNNYSKECQLGYSETIFCLGKQWWTQLWLNMMKWEAFFKRSLSSEIREIRATLCFWQEYDILKITIMIVYLVCYFYVITVFWPWMSEPFGLKTWWIILYQEIWNVPIESRDLKRVWISNCNHLKVFLSSGDQVSLRTFLRAFWVQEGGKNRRNYQKSQERSDKVGFRRRNAKKPHKRHIKFGRIRIVGLLGKYFDTGGSNLKPVLHSNRCYHKHPLQYH